MVTQGVLPNSNSVPGLPSLLLTNVNHILNKLDELTIIVNNNKPDIVAITETWLSDDISDSVCGLPGYSVIRRDRQSGIGGGVMFYIHNSLIYRKLVNVSDSNDIFEVLFVSVRPRVLPRPLSVVIIAVVYSPPWYNASTNNDLCNYILSSIDYFSRQYPCAGF